MAVDFQLYFVYFAAVMITGLLVLRFSLNHTLLKILLAFSGAYLLSISILHLFPMLYIKNTGSPGVFVLVGFFLQVAVEYFTGGIDHGHIHRHKTEGEASHFPVAMMTGLCLHSFLEGTPLATNHSHFGNHPEETFLPLFLGIVLHKIPISLALTAVLTHAKISRTTILICLLAFALTLPAGGGLSHLMADRLTAGQFAVYFSCALALSLGIFLHISTTILFESSENHRFNLMKFAAIAIGVLTAIITL